MEKAVESVAQGMAVDASGVKKAAEGVANEAAAAVGLDPKDITKTIDKLKKCVDKANKKALIEDAKTSVGLALENLDKITSEFSGVTEVTKSQISKKIEKIIREFQDKLKESQKLIQCVIRALPKKLSKMNIFERALSSKAIGQNRIARIISKKTIMSDFPNTIEIRDLGDKIKKIKPMVENELKPIVDASLKVSKAAINAVENEDLTKLPGELKSAINTLNGGGSGGSGGSGEFGGLGDDMGADLGGDSGSGTDLSGDKEPGSNPLSDFSESARKMHEQGTLKDYLNSIIESVGLYFGVFFLLLTMPAMPVIFYLSILYNVILLTWEKFKGLDTYQ